MLYTKCILTPITPEDGLRISVMSRHTLNDGITPHPRINENKTYDIHMKTLAPHERYIGAYLRGSLSFEQYKKHYFEKIRDPENSALVQTLAKMALNENITFLCIEETPDMCHRRLLAEECRIYEPSLDIIFG